MPFKAVLFDLDGTLLNTLEDLADSMNTSLESLGFPVHPVESYKIFVGDGVENLARRTVPAAVTDETVVREAVKRMRSEYDKRWKLKTRPYEGIPEMLEKLKERKIPASILSNKPDDFTRIVAAHFFPDFPFAFVAGAKPGLKKPDPAGAIDIAEKSGIPAGEFLYVGDTNTDMKTAIGAGMTPAGALWGFRTREELLESGAEILLSHPMEISQLFGI